MTQFKCWKTQIYDTVKNKNKIVEVYLEGNDQMKRKTKKTSNEEINEVSTNAR